MTLERAHVDDIKTNDLDFLHWDPECSGLTQFFFPIFLYKYIQLQTFVDTKYL